MISPDSLSSKKNGRPSKDAMLTKVLSAATGMCTQEVWAVLIIAMTDYGVKNLDPTGVVLQSPRGVFNHRGSFCFSGAIAPDI